MFQASSSARSVAEARWEEFRNNAANQGAEWLRGSLQELGRDELRSLAVAGGIGAKIGDRWLPVAQLLCVDGSSGANRAGPIAVFVV